MSEATVNDWEKRRDEKAQKLGAAIVLPAPNELFVDIDNADSQKVFDDNVKLLGDLVSSHTSTPSGSGGEHCHIRVRLSRDVVDRAERIALQAMLGSDRKREILSWMTKDGASEPSCFFEKLTQSDAPVAATVQAAAVEEQSLETPF